MPLSSHRPYRRRASVRRAAAPGALLVAAALVLSSCGGPPDADEIKDAEKAAPNKVYWAGKSFAGLPVAAIERDGRWVTFVYGDCRPDRDADCTPPLMIQTMSICDLNPIEFKSLPRASRPWRHLVVREYADGKRMIAIGASTVIVYARGSLGKRVIAALRPVGEPAGTRPLRARYPRGFVADVRRVHDAYVRLGSVRRVSDRLKISRRAVRYRLELARELGSRRLHRPAGSFAHSLKDIPVMGSIDFQSSCEVETY